MYEGGCPYCSKPVILIDSITVYGVDYGRMYACTDFPKCNSLVGANKSTLEPFGTLANRELRKLRIKTHKLLDPLWRGHPKGARTKVYYWIQKTMHISKEDAHIGKFSPNQCKTMISILQDADYRNEISEVATS